MLLHLRDGSAQAVLRAATLRYKLHAATVLRSNSFKRKWKFAFHFAIRNAFDL